jgi:glycosyltransferase involved in cell wall biosynthesis
MRIAQVSTVSSPVGENGNSIEALVWLLSRELVGNGHEVTVFGAAGSSTDAELVATLPGPYGAAGSPDDWHLCEWINLCRAVADSGRFDVLHTHAYLWGIPLQRLASAPLVHTLHIVPDMNAVQLWSAAPDSCVTATSRHQWDGFPNLQPAAVVHHGVDTMRFTLQTEPEDYVCYLGRFTPGKGVRHAIRIAQELGVRLVLAGPANDYYRETIAPLVDGRTVVHVGHVSGSERDRLLGGARALLYPILYAESFGLVLVESMLCGTPVVATRLGAVPEVVDEGITGFTTESVDDLAAQTLKAFTLDRARVRATAEARFSAARMAREYMQVYERAVAHGR